ncbi:MAG: M20/M25/M40 family metallo-hydrolase [Blastocatellia bacterium]|nr:M20/M25/M40 family metallo-hydrolase [Chloracidobacterium sp.]MBL8184718.1 M20/M25/M40 family metallo-hydrolase [Blastocatellia bacterium]HRJ88654.1 M20/M25/M40 family metallo-hydrolase [Pyrinomonadaceae bacterium]HRK48995.1 M20/M25/M40 family metallo-hydrolase [Pyrinomonadaceae bacterium]
MLRRSIALFLVVFMLAGTPAVYAQKSGKAAKQSTPSFGNVESITAKQLKEWLTFIASDELEGRDTPSRGLDIAAMYIAQHLAGWGIKPAGDNGSYFQKVPLTLDKVVARDTRLDLGGQSYEYGKDFLTSITGAAINDAQVVFAGYGWVIKSKNINAFEGIDVKDKIVVVVNSLPKGITFNDLKGPPGADWMSPAFYAQTNGAKAVINFPTFNNLINWEGSRWNQSEKGSVSYGNQPPLIKIPTITASPRLLSTLFFGEKATATAIFNKTQALADHTAFDLKPEKKISAKVATKTEVIHTQNVVGILEGSDPVLKNEYVAIGAHYDHIGMNPFAPGPDKISNGADDDGSGTVAVMSIAEAFAKGTQKPKRSILFIWHAGEEKGLWGSEHFANNPTVPITSIITQLNIDMIGRYQNPGDENHPQNKDLPKQNEVFTIGSRMMSTELGEWSDAVNKSFLNLTFNLKYDDPNHPEQFFYRSDHYNYARKGIPIIFYMDGSHADYHQVSDSIEKINFESMEKVTKTIFATGWDLANRPVRPKVDKPLKETGN